MPRRKKVLEKPPQEGIIYYLTSEGYLRHPYGNQCFRLYLAKYIHLIGGWPVRCGCQNCNRFTVTKEGGDLFKKQSDLPA